MQCSETVSPETRGKEAFRDLVIAHIMGLQNDVYWRQESEGYKALQDLLLLITERYGEFGARYKG